MHKISLRSRRKLKPKDAVLFAHLEPALFAELAWVVCSTGMIPQKELHESWQMACRVNDEFPDCIRVVDLAAGHGLLAWILVLLARSGDAPILRTAVAIDIKRPKSADFLAAAIKKRWPDLGETVHYVEGGIDAVRCEDDSGTLFVAAHACGSLSDRVLLTAINSRNPVAIMPCCHSLRHQIQTLETLALVSGLQSYAYESVAASVAEIGHPRSIDQIRIDALTALYYEVLDSSIQSEITTFNRIIMGRPPLTQSHGVALHRPVSNPICNIKLLGEIRAYEKVHSLNVNDLTEVQTLSLRPSREWRRSFDLSYWVDDEETGFQLAHALDFLADRMLAMRGTEATMDAHAAFEWLTLGAAALSEARNRSSELAVSICDRYVDPESNKLAFTYRIKIESTFVEITKDDANELRRRLCRALGYLADMKGNKFNWRGAMPLHHQ